MYYSIFFIKVTILLACVGGVLREIGSGLLWLCHQLVARSGRLIKSSWARQQPHRTKPIIDQGAHTTSVEACLGSTTERRKATCKSCNCASTRSYTTQCRLIMVDRINNGAKGRRGSERRYSKQATWVCGGCITLVVGLRHGDRPLLCVIPTLV